MGSIKFFFEKEPELGIYHLQKATELCPSDIYIISRYVLFLIYTGDIEKALNELNRAIRLDPFSHDLLYAEQGICYYWLKDYSSAIESFRKVKLIRNNLFYLSACYFEKGEIEKGNELLKEAEATTGLSSDNFIDSQSYTKSEMKDSLRLSFKR